MRCPYCGYEKEQFTDEHVIPRALGGNLQPMNPFLIRVCDKCNSACGLYIDAAFVRSWFLFNTRALAGQLSFDPAANPVVPLIFMGRASDWKSEESVCDLWLGPTGDSVFHFHRPYPDDPPMVGRPPHIKPEKLDPGSVYVTLIGTNPDWHPVIMRSITQTFPDAPTHYLNASPPGKPLPWPAVPAEHVDQWRWVQGLDPKKARAIRMMIDVTSGDRFLTKVALGLGTRLLGDPFVDSEDATLLRRMLWTRSSQDRAKLSVRGSGFLSGESHLASVLGWEGCHVLLAKPVGNALALTCLFYSAHEGTIQITGEAAHWRGVVHPDGMVWVIAPGLRRFAGPMTLGDYVVAKSTPDPTDPGGPGPLDDLRARLAAAPKSPPFHAPAPVGAGQER